MPKIQYPAKHESLDPLLQFIAAYCRKRGVPDKRIKTIELACEEPLVNIFNYTYPPDRPGDVWVTLNAGPNEIIVELSDSGKTFNPVARPDPDVDQDIDDREIGGLGIMLMRKYTDAIDYKRENDKNILRLTFSF